MPQAKSIISSLNTNAEIGLNGINATVKERVKSLIFQDLTRFLTVAFRPCQLNLLLLGCLIVLTFSNFISAQDLNKTHQTIRKAVEQKDYKTVKSQLETIQKNNSKIFAANNYDYLLARISEKQGDLGIATANYQAVVDRNSILKEYALWHLSQIMRSTGNLMMERLYLQELSLTADKSLLRNAVQKRFARSYLDSGNFEIAIKLLNSQSSTSFGKEVETQGLVKDIKEALPGFAENVPREDLVLLAEAYLQNKQTDEAKEIYNELVYNFPKKTQPDDYALAGAKGLDRLEVGEHNFGKTAPKLSDDEHYKRATIYQFNRNFPLARIHFEAIVKNHPTSKKVPVSLYQIARDYGQERNYEKVIEWSEKLQENFPEDDLTSAALYQAAGAYANLDKTNEAVSRYVKYIDENPDADNLDRAFLNIIDAYRDEGNRKTALEWTAKAQEKFKGEMGEAVALFSQIRIHISSNDWQNALSDLNALSKMKNLGGISIAGGTNRDEVTFLRGFVSEKLGRLENAIDIYLTLDGTYDNYYGWRSNERLESLAKDKTIIKTLENTLVRLKQIPAIPSPEKQKEINNKIKKIEKALSSTRNIENIKSQKSNLKNMKVFEFGRKDIWQTQQKTRSHNTIADELLFLGLYDEGTPELEISMREGQSKSSGSISDFSHRPNISYTLAEYYIRGDMAHRAISYIEPLYKKAYSDLSIDEIPLQNLKMLYPKPYEESLVKYGEEYDVDPRFLLSIMRQESRFQADVKSFAAARGLMQFISTTSLQMADEMKLENFRQDDLYNPPTAIRFGSHYINRIFKDFPNQPPAVAASYNGGEDRMMRWFKRANSDDPDRYVPEVIFSQTKDYVYKVMTNYRIYQMLYDEKLRDIK